MMNGISTAGPTCENKISGSPNSVPSAAMVRSQNIASSQPPPSACPCTDAITGLRGVQRHQGLEARGQPLMVLERVVPPRLLMPTADIEADAEAAAVGPQHYHAGGGVRIRASEHLADGKTHIHCQ